MKLTVKVSERLEKSRFSENDTNFDSRLLNFKVSFSIRFEFKSLA